MSGNDAWDTDDWLEDGPSATFPSGVSPGVDDAKGAKLSNYTLQELARASLDQRKDLIRYQHDRVTISGNNSTAHITLSPALPSDNYIIIFGCGIASGSPDSTSLITHWANKTASSFDVGLYAAPGVGASVTVEWSVYYHVSM